MVTRREFLHRTAAGLLVAVAAPAQVACSGERRDVKGFGRPPETIEGLKDEEVRILRLASLAPSGHNTQPWTVKIAGPGHWIIGSDERFRLPAVDPENRELLLSLGAFIENLTIAAGALGFDVDVDVTAKAPTEAEIAEVRLRKASPREYPLERIKARRTIRNGYSGRDIRTEDLRYVTRHDETPCASIPVPSPHAFYFPNGSQQGKLLQEGLIEANRIQVLREPAQEELSRWIRWSDKDARLNRNGLTPESMEIGGMAGFFVRNFYDARSVLKKSFRERTVDIAAGQVKTCGGWLVVTSTDSEVRTLVAHGRAFERLFLRVRERMIGLHPMTQMLEERESLKTDLAEALGLEGRVQWVLRLGYVDRYPDPVSLRRPVSWFVRS